MTRFYLVTGFLGAGKTTFLRAILPCLSSEKVALIVNDFGRERVDAVLLQGQGVEISEINNGSIFCACRSEQFREGVEAALQNKPDLIITEASGLADPTNLSGVLDWLEDGTLEYGGTICLVDAARFHKVKDTALVVRKQLSTADGIVVNKVDLAQPQQLEDIRSVLAELCPGIPVLETSYGQVDSEWFLALRPRTDLKKGAAHIRDITQQKLTLCLRPGLTRQELEKFLTQVAYSTYRIKGFAALDSMTGLVDCVGSQVHIEPWSGKTEQLNCLTVLFANGLPAKTCIQSELMKNPVGELM